METLIRYRSEDGEFIKIGLISAVKKEVHKLYSPNDPEIVYSKGQQIVVYVENIVQYNSGHIELDKNNIPNIKSKLEELANEKANSDVVITAIRSFMSNIYECEECAE